MFVATIVPVMVVEATVWLALTVYVPTPPVPLIRPVMLVPPVTPVPLITEPIPMLPDVTAVTVKVVPDIEPVNTGVWVPWAMLS